MLCGRKKILIILIQALLNTVKYGGRNVGLSDDIITWGVILRNTGVAPASYSAKSSNDCQSRPNQQLTGVKVQHNLF